MLEVNRHAVLCRLVLPALLALATGLGQADARAQTGRFDLLGPKIDVHVVRGEHSLPIASVPNLQPGDKLQVHADLPTTQSVHLLLVVAFLRGTTNPPPDKWFTRIETWDKRVRGEGVSVTVPDEAQQALIFVAPETGGDFSTLKSAVRGRPGIFVRASQDLNEASFEQSRIERYAQAIKQVPPGSPAELLDHSHKLAATLQLKPNDDCFKRAPDLQAACLSQSGTALLLDDGHSQTLAQTLSTGPSSDLIGAVAGTPMANVANVASYSAYVGTVLDVVRLMTNLHTAKYQYIPAIAFPDGDSLNLRLNAAPSFNNPKSVIVIALPAISKAVSPPLQLQDPRHVSCLLQTRMVLPLNGAPLVFATGFAHDLTLHLNEPGPDGRTDLPLVPDAYEGGLVVSDSNVRRALAAIAPEAHAAGTAPGAVNAAANTAGSTAGNTAGEEPATIPRVANGATGEGSKTAVLEHEDAAKSAVKPAQALGGPVMGTGVVHGFWGFDSFEGPTLALERLPGRDWTVSSQGELFTGRSNTVSLYSSGTACVATVSLADGPAARPVDWHVDEADAKRPVAVKLPLEKTTPGGLSLSIRQYGETPVQTVALTAYADAVRVEEAVTHAGDGYLMLRGSGLGGVKSATVNGVTFSPGQDAPGDDKLLRLESSVTGSSKRAAFKAGDRLAAELALRDGRSLTVPVRVDGARPSVTLLSMSFAPTAQAGLAVALGDPKAIPIDGKLTFAIRSDTPAKFPRTQRIEVALADSSASTTLSLQDRSLVLQDTHTALGFVTPLATFGPSVFGPLQMRAIAADGSTSDWMPLGTLVRTPVIRQVVCSGRGSTVRSPAAATVAGPAVAPVQDAAAYAPAPQTNGEESTVSTPCTLSGSELFLVEAVSADSAFAQAVEVPAGFAAESLAVPRPADGRTIFLRLRDDPDHVASVVTEGLRARNGTAP